MIFKLIIKETAYDDLQIAYDYYELQSYGLGEKFLAAITDRLSYIEKYPQHFKKVYKDFRQALIDNFPYLIIYEVSGKEIVVYSFFHSSQDPDKKFL